MGKTAANYDNTGFRYRKDDGSETGASWWYAVDTNGSLDTGVTHRMRIEMTETNGGSSNNVSIQWEAKLNTGSWFSITTSSTIVKAVTSGNFSEGDDCTQQLGGGGTFLSDNNGMTIDGLTNSHSISANELLETEVAFEIITADVTDSDTLYMRATAVGEVNAYTTTPAITVNIPPGKAQVSWAMLEVPAAGNITVAPGNAETTCSAESPSVVLGSISIVAGVAGTTCSAQGVTVINDIILNAGNVETTCSAESPSVVLGSISLSGGNAATICSAESPSVVLGSISLSGGNAATTCSTQDVTVIAGGGGGIDIRSSSSANFTADNSPACNYPAGLASGDVVIANVQTSGGYGTLSDPTNDTWTLVAENSIATNPRAFTYIRVADGTEGASEEFNFSNSIDGSIVMIAFTGVDNTTPQDATAITDGNATSESTANIDSITTVTNNAMLVVFLGPNSSSVTSDPNGNGFTEEIEITGERTNSGNYKLQATAGASGTFNFTLSASREWCGIIMALRPASGGDVTVAAGYCETVCSAQAPTVVQSSLSLSAGYVETVCSAQGVTVINDIILNAGYCETVCSAQTPTVVQSSLTLSAGYSETVCSAQAPTVVQSSLTLSAGYSETICSAQGVSVVQSSLTLSAGYAETVCSAQAPTVVQSSLSLSAGYAETVCSAQTPTVVQSSLTLSAGYAETICSAQGVTVDAGGGITLSAGYSETVCSAQAPTVVQSSLTLSAGYSETICSAQGVSVVQSSLSLSAGYVETVCSAQGVTIIQSSLTLSAGYAETICSAQGVSVVQGSISYVALDCGTICTSENSTIIQGGLSLSVGYVEVTCTALTGLIEISTSAYIDYTSTLLDYILYSSNLDDYKLYSSIADTYKLYVNSFEEYELFTHTIYPYELYSATLENELVAKTGTIAKKLTLTVGADNSQAFVEPDIVAFYLEYPNQAPIAYIYGTNPQVKKPAGTEGIYIFKIKAAQTGDVYIQAYAEWQGASVVDEDEAEDWVEITEKETLYISSFIGDN